MLGEDSNTYRNLNRSEVMFKVNYFYHKISQTTDVMDVFSIQSIFVKLNFFEWMLITMIFFVRLKTHKLNLMENFSL